MEEVQTELVNPTNIFQTLDWSKQWSSFCGQRGISSTSSRDLNCPFHYRLPFNKRWLVLIQLLTFVCTWLDSHFESLREALASDMCYSQYEPLRHSQLKGKSLDGSHAVPSCFQVTGVFEAMNMKPVLYNALKSLALFLGLLFSQLYS